MSTDVPIEYVNYKLCKEMGWNYRELMEQPRFFIEQLIDIIGIVRKHEARQQ